LSQAELVDVDAIPRNDLPNLLGRLLETGVGRLLRQGIDRSYISEVSDTRTIRGKLDLSASVKRDLLRIPAAVCVIDELHRDVLHNQIIKTTLWRVAASPDVDKLLQHRLRALVAQLADITDIKLRREHFRRVQLHRNNQFYGFLLNICELCYTSLLADEETGSWRFIDFERDEQMRLMFQNFVFNFYRLEQRDFRVSSEQFHWATSEPPTGQVPLLPTMNTDVSLTSRTRKIVVECKFSKEALQAHYGKTARSEHLYQLYAYLRNLEARGGPDAHCEGLLLYPTVAEPVDFSFTAAGHRIRVYTLNLNRDWQFIREDLLSLLERPTSQLNVRKASMSRP
jgi:5-methylcytosine-specific restriction enzyme subunit McrC